MLSLMSSSALKESGGGTDPACTRLGSEEPGQGETTLQGERIPQPQWSREGKLQRLPRFRSHKRSAPPQSRWHVGLRHHFLPRRSARLHRPCRCLTLHRAGSGTATAPAAAGPSSRDPALPRDRPAAGQSGGLTCETPPSLVRTRTPPDTSVCEKGTGTQTGAGAATGQGRKCGCRGEHSPAQLLDGADVDDAVVEVPHELRHVLVKEFLVCVNGVTCKGTNPAVCPET